MSPVSPRTARRPRRAPVSLAQRQTLAMLALLLVVICGIVLLVARSRDPLLGLWDSGRFSSRVMPEPERMADEELGRLRLQRRILFQPAAGPPQGESLAELFRWYDLDPRYVEATVNAQHLDPQRVPSEPFDVVLLNDN